MGKIIVNYNLVFQKESASRSIDLLLAEMTHGIQYYSKKDGVQMDRIQDNVPFVNKLVQGEILSVEQLEDEIYSVKYALPADIIDVELGGITNLWSIIAGEVFNFHFIKFVSLVELELPDYFNNYYRGPCYGIEGIRNFTMVEDGPLFGSIIKPNIGLNPEKSANVVSILANAGFNFIKDDEICVNPSVSLLRQRVHSISNALEEYKQNTGKNVLYAANVTSDLSVLGKIAEIALQSGANALMIDPFCTGLSAIDYIRRNFDAPIYVHRVGYGIYCLNPKFNIKYDVFLKLFRLLGADFSHVGGICGKSKESINQTKGFLSILRKESNIKPTWPVVTGICIESMGEYYDFYGDDTLFMEHIDIYKDAESSKKKLQLLKSEIVK